LLKIEVKLYNYKVYVAISHIRTPDVHGKNIQIKI